MNKQRREREEGKNENVRRQTRTNLGWEGERRREP